jgi:hypothetical protein
MIVDHSSYKRPKTYVKFMSKEEAEADPGLVHALYLPHAERTIIEMTSENILPIIVHYPRPSSEFPSETFSYHATADFGKDGHAFGVGNSIKAALVSLCVDLDAAFIRTCQREDRESSIPNQYVRTEYIKLETREIYAVDVPLPPEVTSTTPVIEEE